MSENRAKEAEGAEELATDDLPIAPPDLDTEPKEQGYVSTGFVDWDSMTGGLKAGQLTVLASTTGVGKTSLALCTARHVALQNIPVVFISLELNWEEVVQRLTTAHSRISASEMSTGSLTDAQWHTITATTNALYSASFWLRHYHSIEEIRAVIWDIKAQRGGASLVVIDSFQLLKHGDQHPNRLDELNAIGRACKALAQECKVPVLLTSQLPQMVSKRENKRPVLTDLSLWGDIDTIADVVALMHRPGYQQATEKLAWEPPKCTCAECSRAGDMVDISIAKNRHGPVGKFRLFFQPAYGLFSNLEPH